MTQFLKFSDVELYYDHVYALKGVSLELNEGETIALIGANGAGKSSTIMAIAGHVRVFGGAIVLDGKDITAMPARQRVRRGIAIAPEGRRLFPDLTVGENLTVGGYILPRARSDERRAMVIELFPRLGERLGQAAGSLSGGEQQMLAIGRALMAEPRLLMIDEVSLGLMPKMIDVCYEAIAALKADGMTILLVEQSTKRALEVADRVCVLESGRQVWAGSADEARRDPEMIEAYLGLREEVAQ